MGNIQSNDVSTSVQLLNEAMTNLVNTNTTSASATTISAQSMKVKFIGGSVNNCTINIDQTANISQNTKVMSTFNETSDLVTALTTAATDKINQASGSDIGALALSLNCQENSISVKDSVTNLIKTNITNDNKTFLNDFLKSIQDLDVSFTNENIDCGGKSLTISQGMISHQISRLLTNMIVADKVTGTSDASTDAETIQSLKSKQEGLGSLIIMIVLIIGAVIFFPVIAPLIMSKFAGNNKALKIFFNIISIVIVILICYYGYKAYKWVSTLL